VSDEVALSRGRGDGVVGSPRDATQIRRLYCGGGTFFVPPMGLASGRFVVAAAVPKRGPRRSGLGSTHRARFSRGFPLDVRMHPLGMQIPGGLFRSMELSLLADAKEEFL
jgi:hypothetical protein